MKFNLSLDDFSPHPNSGFNFESINWCNKFIQIYPDIKIDLFVPAKYGRLNQQIYPLSKYRDWVDQVNDLPDNYRVCCHGLHHRRAKSDFKWHRKHDSNNDEFQFLNQQQAKHIINEMLVEFDLSGLKYAKAFRPPGWKISRSACQELTDRGWLIAGDTHHFEAHGDSVPGIRWVSVNCNLVPPLNLGSLTDIYIAAHTSDWTNNYFDERRYNLVKDILADRDNHNFVFIGE